MRADRKITVEKNAPHSNGRTDLLAPCRDGSKSQPVCKPEFVAINSVTAGALVALVNSSAQAWLVLLSPFLGDGGAERLGPSPGAESPFDVSAAEACDASAAIALES